MKRLFDILLSSTMLLLLFPVFALISLLIKLDSIGPVFYLQIRVGHKHRNFKIIKFRTMTTTSENQSLQLTVGNRDQRITSLGYFLRKYKLDELPQLLNIIMGEMSFVGPRPEVPKYVKSYTSSQLKVLSVKPGLVDIASLAYFNENELLANSYNPESFYINEVMPQKLSLSINYIDNQSLLLDIKIIALTILRIAGVKYKL